MANSWLRLWHDMPTDPKFRVIAKKSGRPLSEVVSVFILMMTNASANEAERGSLAGWDDEDAAAALDMDAAHVTAIREAMQSKTLEGDRLSGWSKRQPKREDGSAERVRAFREREKRTVTQCNADVTNGNAREDKTREDKIRSDSLPSIVEQDAACEFDGGMDEGIEIKIPGSDDDVMLAFVEASMGGHCRKRATAWLGNLVKTNGQTAVSEAYQRLLTTQASGVVIHKPLPWLDTAAKRCKAEAWTPPKPKKSALTIIADMEANGGF